MVHEKLLLRQGGCFHGARELLFSCPRRAAALLTLVALAFRKVRKHCIGFIMLLSPPLQHVAFMFLFRGDFKKTVSSAQRGHQAHFGAMSGGLSHGLGICTVKGSVLKM